MRIEKSPITPPDWLATALKIGLITSATTAMFLQDLSIVFKDALQNEATNYILAVPFLFVYLVYRKRRMVKASIPLESPNLFEKVRLNEVVGGLLFLTSFLLYWYGSYTFTPLEIHLFALPIFAAACVLLLFNVQTLRQLLFPITFLFLLVPPPVEILYNLGAILSVLSSELAYHLLAITGFPVSLGSEHGNPVINLVQKNGEPIPFMVDIACSGIYSQIGFLIFALFVAYIIRDKHWKKTLIFILGLPLIYALNVLRLFSIVVIGYHFGKSLAMEVFHILGGWMLIFLGTLVLLVISEIILKVRVVPKDREKCPECADLKKSSFSTCRLCGRIHSTRWRRVDKRDIAKAAILVIALFLILSIQTSVFALTEGPAEIIQQTVKGEEVTTKILPQIPEYDLKYMYRDEDFEARAKQDASLVYAYIPDNNTENVVWTTIEVAATKSPLHRWETCLIQWWIRHGYQPPVEQIELEDVQLLENPPIIGRYFIFKNKETNITQAVLYWYQSAVFQTNSTSTTKHIKISLIAYPEKPDELPRIKDTLLEMATEITDYWKPIERWSPVALTISRNGDKLVIFTLALLCAFAPLYIIEKRREKKENTIAYKKLSATNQQLIKTIHETEKNTLPTLNNISETHHEITEEPIEEEELLQKLSELEEIDVINKDIANREDWPIQIWKTNCST